MYLKNEFKRIEKRAVSIILPDCDYHTGIERLGFKRIEDHYNHLCRTFFSSIENNEDHKLKELLPSRHESTYSLHNSHKYKVPPVCISRASVVCSNYSHLAPEGGGGTHVEQKGMLVGNFEFNP